MDCTRDIVNVVTKTSPGPGGSSGFGHLLGVEFLDKVAHMAYFLRLRRAKSTFDTFAFEDTSILTVIEVRFVPRPRE